jgi:hypothetical protein
MSRSNSSIVFGFHGLQPAIEWFVDPKPASIITSGKRFVPSYCGGR